MLGWVGGGEGGGSRTKPVWYCEHKKHAPLPRSRCGNSRDDGGLGEKNKMVVRRAPHGPHGAFHSLTVAPKPNARRNIWGVRHATRHGNQGVRTC